MSEKNYKEIYKEIQKIILDIRNSSEEFLEIKNCRIVNDLGFDSIDVMTLISQIEEKFNIRFEEEMLLIQNFDTVDSLTELTKKIVEAK